MTQNWTNEAKRRCAQREVAMRQRVYKKRVADGSMSQDEAQHEIELMQEIASDYMKLEQQDAK